MTYVQQYTFLDGAWHAIGYGEHTVCGIAIPFGNGYTTEPDKKAHCGPDTKNTLTEVDDDPAENKAKADEVNAAKVRQPIETVTGGAGEELVAGEVGSVKGGKSK